MVLLEDSRLEISAQRSSLKALPFENTHRSSASIRGRIKAGLGTLAVVLVAQLTSGTAVAATCAKLPIAAVNASTDDGDVPANVLDNNLSTR